MGLYVEIMCDVLTEGSPPGRPTQFICWSSASNNPQGFSVADARREAKVAGYKRIGGRDVCPGCQKWGAAPASGRALGPVAADGSDKPGMPTKPLGDQP